MTQGIYAITNKVNGKVYIGASGNIKKRFNAHKSMLKKGDHHSSKLQDDWNEYGADSFKFSVVQEVEESINLFEIEQEFISHYKAWRDYNGSCGGGRPKGTTKPDSLVFIKVVLGVTKETEEWYKSLPEGTKAKTMRDAIALYRATNEQDKE